MLALLCSLAVAAPAGASSGMKIGVADDKLMLRISDEVAPTALEWQKNGVDQTRLTLIWGRIAPDAQKTKKPSGFEPRDNTSRLYQWGSIDRAVAALNARGIEITLGLATPAPIWATEVPSRHEGTYKPKASEFGAFAHAVATRYKGKVSSFTLINEPNLWQFLTPQVSCSSSSVSSCKPASPAIYRRLFSAGYKAIKSVSKDYSVWGGALGPGPRPDSNPRKISLGPLTFLRNMGCVTTEFKRDRSSSGCKGFEPLKMDGVAMHPHTAGRAPNEPARDADSITIPTISRLTTTMDKIQRAGGVLNGSGGSYGEKHTGLNVFIDEYGVQTSPPDRLMGVSLANQDAYYQQAAQMMWKNPRVKLLLFYLWRDEPVDGSSFGAGTWQSGVYFASGKAKPSAKSFPHPFWVDLERGSRSATIWGQVRPGGSSVVKLQAKVAGYSTYKTIKSLTTNSQGFFSTKAYVRKKTSSRFQYGSPSRLSSVRTVAP